MKNTGKFFTIVLNFLLSFESATYAQGYILGVKDFKFEKVLYRKSGYSNLIINNDKSFLLEVKAPYNISNCCNITDRKTITKGSLIKPYNELLYNISQIVNKKIIVSEEFVTDTPKTKLCIYYDSKIECFEYYICPEELKILDRFLAEIN